MADTDSLDLDALHRCLALGDATEREWYLAKACRSLESQLAERDAEIASLQRSLISYHARFGVS